MPDRKPSRPVRGRHQARKRAVDLLFEAEARGLSPVEVVDGRTALAATNPDLVQQLRRWLVERTMETTWFR